MQTVAAEDEYKFDGSEFSATSFKDTDFDKKDYRETKSRESATAKTFSLAPGLPAAKRRSNYDITLGGIAGEESRGARERNAFEDQFGPIMELAGDWVPGKIDLTSNGAFTIEPFNGTPVPYDLNGHVDPQRGKP